MRNYILYISLLSLLFISCEKQEIPVAPIIPGDVITSQVNMGSDYLNQLFFNLNDNAIISQNSKMIWDLSFESSDEGWHVLINSSKMMKVAFYEGATLSDDLVLSDANWVWDASTGNLDSTAIGDWRSTQGIYAIDGGYNSVGVFQGNYKLKVVDVDNTSFTIQLSHFDGSNEQTIEIIKDKTINFTYFSFENEVVEVAPQKDNWDLEFTQYTYVYYDLEEITPYLVVGVLLNRNNVQAAIEQELAFDKIDLEYASTLNFNNSLEIIGFNWKSYNFDEGYYTIVEGRSFIIRDVEGIFYKLRFIDFYTETGQKGAPKFEFQKL